ncbi:MAG: YdeI/OmpD-associated family protein [Actinomycetota bacterium]|nr:YdeI/OmpD-associated family protein [Actinomycetota bacterium]
MSALDDAPRIQPVDRAEWRDWLAGHHATGRGVWVVTYKKAAAKPSPAYEELICEALCFGWIDATARAVDAERTALYFCPRRKGSVWAATNKARVERLIAGGLMQPAGLAVIDRAVADGSWTALDRSESLSPPEELEAAFDRYPRSRAAFDAFPASARKQLIGWVDSAKRPETRERRADEAARRAQQGMRAFP